MSFECRQHLLSQLDFSRDLIDAVAATQERLEERERRDRRSREREGKEEERKGKERRI